MAFQTNSIRFLLISVVSSHRKRIHTAPLQPCPGSVMPSKHCNYSVKVSTDETKITSILYNLTKTKTATAVGVFDSSQHELEREVSRYMGTHNDLSTCGYQERRRQPVHRERLHRVASRLLARATTTNAPTVLCRRRHSTPTPNVIAEEASHVTQELEREQNHGQSQKPRASRRRSLLSRARSLRGVKSLSDLKAIARRMELQGQHGASIAERHDQTERKIKCEVVRMRSVNSATSAPLYLFRADE